MNDNDSSSDRTRYKRSPFLLLSWDTQGHLILTECNNFRQFRVSGAILTVLNSLSHPQTLDDLTQDTPPYPRSIFARVLDRLSAVNIVLDDKAGEQTKAPLLSVFELAMQRQTAYGGGREEGQNEGPAPLAFKQPDSQDVIHLPQGGWHESGRTLSDVLDTRTSIRTYSNEGMSLSELAQFLYKSARVRRVIGPPENQRSSRPYPGGGARHTLELYLLCENVRGVTRGVYYYHPLQHALYLIKRPGDQYTEILRRVRANAGGLLNRDPCVIIHITSVFGRMTWKYNLLSLATIYRDVGALYQTMYLVATDMGLAPCAIAGIQDIANAAWLGLDPLEEAQIGCFILGKM